MKSASIYGRYLSTGFLGANRGDFAGAARKLDLNYAEFLPADLDTPILDAGCGMGHFLSYLEQKGYKNLLGVDASPEISAINISRSGQDPYNALIRHVWTGAWAPISISYR